MTATESTREHGTTNVSDSPEIHAGLVFGVQLAIAVVSGVPQGIGGRDAVRAGGEIAQARCDLLGVVS